MSQFIISGISGIVGALLTAIGSYFVYRIRQKNHLKTTKFHLYMIINQMKSDIDKAYERLVEKDICMISPLFVYDGTYNYIENLCELKGILSVDEIQIVNQFFEDVKSFDNIRMSLNNTLSILNSGQSSLPPDFYANTQRSYSFLFEKYNKILEEFKKSNYYQGQLILLLDKLK